MSSLNDQLTILQQARDNMKIALQNKGKAASKDIRTYANLIDSIPQGSGDVKLFDTVEHMQADPNPSEGDLAVVYREELQPVTEESEFDSCTFPQTVVLDEAFTESIYGSFRAIDQSVMFSGTVEMSSSSFRFDGYGESSEIRIQYESQDGITYTRTDGGEELQEFGTTIKWSVYHPWDDVIGNFMKIGGNYFEGMYEYKTDTENNAYITNIDYDGTNVTYNANTKIPFDINVYSRDYLYVIETESNNGEPLTVTAYPCRTVTQDITNNKLYVCGSSGSGVPSSTDTITVKHIDMSTGSYTQETLTSSYIMTTTSSYVRTYNEITGKKWFYTGHSQIQIFTTDGTIRGLLYINGQPEYYETKYFMATTQLNATSDYVYEKTFYGKNGVDIGTLGTTVSTAFNDVSAEIYAKIQNVYDDMTPLVASNNSKMAGLGTYIKLIPSKTDGTPLLDTSNVTNMYSMFSGCSNLTTIPLLNTSKVTNMQSMFYSCSSLNNESLNNILAMCTNAAKITSNKTLKYIRLTKEQANICKTLSNYSAFIAAGWTTGY